MRQKAVMAYSSHSQLGLKKTTDTLRERIAGTNSKCGPPEHKEILASTPQHLVHLA
jgi:hypothetical protein